MPTPSLTTPSEIGLEAWRRFIQRFDPASAQANLSLMSRTLKPPKRRVEHIAFLVEDWGAMVRRQDEWAGRRALADDTNRAILMDMCPWESDRYLLLSSDRFDTSPKVQSAMLARMLSGLVFPLQQETKRSSCATRVDPWAWAR